MKFIDTQSTNFARYSFYTPQELRNSPTENLREGSSPFKEKDYILLCNLGMIFIALPLMLTCGDSKQEWALECLDLVGSGQQ